MVVGLIFFGKYFSLKSAIFRKLHKRKTQNFIYKVHSTFECSYLRNHLELGKTSYIFGICLLFPIKIYQKQISKFIKKIFF